MPKGGERLYIHIINFLLFIFSFKFYSPFNLLKINLDLSNIYSFDFKVQYNSLFISDENEWSLSIPKLFLNNIPIKEGTDEDTLEDYIGHFKISSYITGNVCLAAHNNGFQNNYFENINQLKVGDEIYYKYEGISKKYLVSNITTISEKDLSVLNTNNIDMLTLITCISGSPELRLCIKAISKE